MRKPNRECVICGEKFYSYHADNVCCSKKCSSDNYLVKAMRRYEEHLGIKDFKKWLTQKYVHECKGIREIMELLNTKSNRTVSRVIKYNGIKLRTGSDAIKAQWVGNQERRNQQSKFMADIATGSTAKRLPDSEVAERCFSQGLKMIKRKIVNGYTVIEYKCLSCGYLGKKKRISYEINCPKCAVIKRTIADQSTVKSQRSKLKSWKSEIHFRDGNSCLSCGDESNLVAHHLESFAHNKYLRNAVDNGITLCADCHKDFHKRYSYYNNTKAQMEEYLGHELTTLNKVFQLEFNI